MYRQSGFTWYCALVKAIARSLELFALKLTVEVYRVRSEFLLSSLSGLALFATYIQPTWASPSPTADARDLAEPSADTLEISSTGKSVAEVSLEYSEFVPEPVMESVAPPELLPREPFSWSHRSELNWQYSPFPEETNIPLLDISETPPLLSQSTEETPPTEVEVKQIRVTGSTIFSEEELNTLLASYQGRSLTIEELRQAADSITEQYLNQGYINTRAILGNQVLEDGIVEIQVIEGSLEEIVIQGSGRLSDRYIRNRIRRGARAPLNSASLENQLRLLKTDPLFENVEASLQPGSGIGQSKLTVRVSLAKPFSANFFVDNYSTPSVGAERMGVRVAYQNVTGLGDRISLGYNRPTNGSDTDRYEFSYRVPVNARDGALTVQFLPDNNEVSNIALQDLGISGETKRYEFDFRQPLVRSPRQEFALSLGFSHHRGQTFLNNIPFGFGSGPDDRGRTRSSAIRFGQEYLRRDVGGIWAARSQFLLGIDAFDATINPDPIPDSRFFSWNLSAQRLQRLGKHQLLAVRANLQLATTSLLPSRQFVIGGGQSLRGYRQNARSGDNGFVLSIEDRITIQRNASGQPSLTFAPFLDLGQVWNKSGNPNLIASQKFLMGAGMAILWEVMPGWNVRVDYGVPLVELPDRGNNAQDNGFYFSVNVEL